MTERRRDRTVTHPNASPTVGDEVVPQIVDTVAWVEVDGEAVLFDEVGRIVHVLNPTATLVWAAIDGRRSLGRIADDLTVAFGADPDVVHEDVRALADGLMSRGLVIPAGASDLAARPPLELSSRATPDRPHGATRFLEEPPSG
jgi:Coenzyme PQQ synthesis protein D (PqqD)